MKDFEMQLVGLKHVAELTSMSDDEKRSAIERIYSSFGLNSPFGSASNVVELPQQIERKTLTASTLLRNINSRVMNAKDFFEELTEMGYVKQMVYHNGNSHIAHSKDLIGEGLKFGVNQKNGYPLFYEDMFEELVIKIRERSFALWAGTLKKAA